MCPAAGADKGGNVTVLSSLSWPTVNSGKRPDLHIFFHRQVILAKPFIEGPAQIPSCLSFIISTEGALRFKKTIDL